MSPPPPEAPVTAPGVAGDSAAPERPRNAAAKKLWEDYARSRGIADVEEKSKDDLIAAVDTLDAE